MSGNGKPNFQELSLDELMEMHTLLRDAFANAKQNYHHFPTISGQYSSEFNTAIATLNGSLTSAAQALLLCDAAVGEKRSAVKNLKERLT